MKRNEKSSFRALNVGAGSTILHDFEGLDITWMPGIDYVQNAEKPLPFRDNTFDILFASHVLEHIEWYKTTEVIKEWIRILKPHGHLEIWVPNGEIILTTMLDHSRGIPNSNHLDGFNLYNPSQDPFLWVNGHLFYGANTSYQSWHKAIFTFHSLSKLLQDVGMENIVLATQEKYRGGGGKGKTNLGIHARKRPF